MCYGLYHAREQVGFARVVSDRETFAYIGDVYILEAHRCDVRGWLELTGWNRRSAVEAG